MKTAIAEINKVKQNLFISKTVPKERINHYEQELISFAKSNGAAFPHISRTQTKAANRLAKPCLVCTTQKPLILY
ncbi:MAG TPA: hypothetical protein VNM69_13310 [Bacillus sp. (in: firmicutes)]|uniref:hypothetical protein n=1 Tax=Bacillus litorisediminis TaxID=2922713 RepID=UPI001FAB647F|nr:hypothetical protein [Bacillus litorisediminis]HWO76848.1 hypothetical protein [Bacillus sp. (in: firmicutes)]